MRISFVPRERRFYDLFDQQAEHMVIAARLLVEMLEGSVDAVQCRAQIRDREHLADEVTHEVVSTLNRTFVTPFDREDIYALTSGLDDVLDYVDEVADTMIVYRIDDVPGPAVRMAHLIKDAAVELQRAVTRMITEVDMRQHWVEVHRLENEGDTVSREAIGELFMDHLDPIQVIKLKDFYALLEDGLDRCADVANVIEAITIKHA